MYIYGCIPMYISMYSFFEVATSVAQKIITIQQLGELSGSSYKLPRRVLRCPQRSYIHVYLCPPELSLFGRFKVPGNRYNAPSLNGFAFVFNLGFWGQFRDWDLTVVGSRNFIVEYRVLLKQNIFFSSSCLPSNTMLFNCICWHGSRVCSSKACCSSILNPSHPTRPASLLSARPPSSLSHSLTTHASPSRTSLSPHPICKPFDIS